MSYPYGPESYPTIEKLESESVIDMFRTVYSYDKERLEKEGTSATDALGLALSHALEFAMDWNDMDLDYFVEDLLAVLEDKVISKADKEDYEYGVNTSNNYLLKTLKAERADEKCIEACRRVSSDSDETPEEYYDRRIKELEEQVADFKSKKIKEVTERCEKSE